MIALLTGTVVHKSPDYIILDVNGVGYRVQIPFSTYYELPEEGLAITLHIHTHVKEDAINLYGFRSSQEKSVFQLLIGVSGIGPKLAKDILSNIQIAEFVQSVTQGNLARLSAIPGIGKKTAERLVLELREKAAKIGIAATAPAAARGIDTGIKDDVASALVNLGYKEAVVNKVVSELDVPTGTPMETVLKQALKQLMK